MFLYIMLYAFQSVFTDIITFLFHKNPLKRILPISQIEKFNSLGLSESYNHVFTDCWHTKEGRS